MKTTKKILALLLAVVLVAAMMAVPALAEGETDPSPSPTPDGSITINKVPTEDHTFTAYQIFEGTLNSDSLEGIQWGADVTASSTALAALASSLKSAFVTSGEPKAINDLSDSSTAAAFAKAFAGLSETQAKELGNILGAWSGVTGSGKTGTLDETTYLIEELADGYYLVKDSISNTATGVDDFVSNYLLQLVGAGEIDVKGDLASLTKGISKSADGTFGEAVTAEYGETVYYQLTATLPTTIADYKSYTLVFHDTPAPNVTIDETSFKVDGAAASAVFKDGEYTVTVTVDPTKIDDQKTVVVTYSGVLQDTATPGGVAVPGGVEKNTAYLEYSNDPHSSSLGSTPPVYANVTTYSASFVKIDGVSKALLAGAKFELYRDEACTDKVILVKDNETTYHVVQPDESAEIESAEIVTKDLTAGIVIKGLDSATTYSLKETAAPAGYNELTGPVSLPVSGDTTTAKASITDGVYTETDNVVAIENNSGTTLPETGGIGTTLFIVFGALAVMTAGIFLVTNQRMKKEGF